MKLSGSSSLLFSYIYGWNCGLIIFWNVLLAVKLLFECSKSFFRDYKQSLSFISPSSETKMTTWVIEGSRLRRVHSPQWIWRTRETARSLRFLRHNKQLKIGKDYRYITDWRTYESHCWLYKTPSNLSLCNTSFDNRCVLAGANISWTSLMGYCRGDWQSVATCLFIK